MSGGGSRKRRGRGSTLVGTGHSDGRRKAGKRRGKSSGINKPRVKRGKRGTLPEGVRTYDDAWTVLVAAGKSTLIAAGHPWVFSGAVEHALPPRNPDKIAPGAPCVVFDHRGFHLGRGYYNPDSQLAVRMVALATSDDPPQDAVSDDVIVRQHLGNAFAMREQLGIVCADRSAYRLVNGAGDMLPGLGIDRYADGAVVVISTAGAARWVDIIADWLTTAGGCNWVVCRAGYDTHPSEGLAAGTLRSMGDVPATVDVNHHGITIPLSPRDGSKTGLFTDQWDNHLEVAKLCEGRFVLDAYCHTGGFGLHAARAGAARVLCVDASARACELAEEAAKRSGLSQVEVYCGDAVNVLRDIADGIGGQDAARPSVIVVDPPKFVTRSARIEDALRKYTHLNAAAMQALVDEGWLISCSCSGRLDTTTFLRMLAHAARRANRIVSVVEIRGAGRDHPTTAAHGEGRYLKVAICRITNR